jgi:Mg-chelatase subunit ChlD
MLFVAGIIAYFSIKAIDIGEIAMQVNMEKQLLDTHGILVGQSIIVNGIDETCRNGQFTGAMAESSENVFNQTSQEADDRQIRCNDAEGELIERLPGDPSGPPGTFRRYRVSSNYNAADPTANAGGTEREVFVEVREIHGEVEQARAQIVFLLDYSGSMNLSNRIQSLRQAIQTFISQGYDMDYGVVLYSSTNIADIPIGFGNNHNTQVLNLVNGTDANQATNFIAPLQKGIDLLNQRDSGEVYIILISDGDPNEPSGNSDPVPVVNNEIRNIDPQICLTKTGNQKCITVYTLGVDDANTNLLEEISGNAATPPNQRDQFVFEANASQTQAAFQAIIEDILCRYGPLDPLPTQEELETLNVFVNEQPLDEGTDYEYDVSSNMIKFFDEEPFNACSTIIQGNGEITLRYGQPRLIVPNPF